MKLSNLVFACLAGLTCGATLALFGACEPSTCQDFKCDIGQSSLIFRNEGRALAGGRYVWQVVLDDGAATLAGDCEINGASGNVSCEEDDEPQRVIRDGDLIALRLDLNYEDDDGDIVQPETLALTLTIDDELVIEDTYELEYRPRDSCHEECLDAALYVGATPGTGETDTE